MQAVQGARYCCDSASPRRWRRLRRALPLALAPEPLRPRLAPPSPRAREHEVSQPPATDNSLRLRLVRGPLPVRARWRASRRPLPVSGAVAGSSVRPMVPREVAARIRVHVHVPMPDWCCTSLARLLHLMAACSAYVVSCNEFKHRNLNALNAGSQQPEDMQQQRPAACSKGNTCWRPAGIRSLLL